MARLFAFNILLFLMPFVAFAGYLLITRGSFRNISDWQMQTIAWLALSGSVLMVAGLVYFLQFQPGEAGRAYLPARFEDGKIIPGRLVPGTPDEAAAE